MSTAVPPKLQLAAALTLLASGGFQHNVGNDYLVGMCQSTVNKCANGVIKEIQRVLCPKFIKFCPEQSANCIEAFMTKYKIPGGKYM